MWRQPPYFFSLAVRGHPRDPLQRKIASFTLTNHDDNERKRIALKYTMLCGCIYGLKCGTVFVGMTVPWKLLPDRRTTKVRASVGPTTILPVRVRGPALILKTECNRKELPLMSHRLVTKCSSYLLQHSRFTSRPTHPPPPLILYTTKILKVHFIRADIYWWTIKHSTSKIAENTNIWLL